MFLLDLKSAIEEYNQLLAAAVSLRVQTSAAGAARREGEPELGFLSRMISDQLNAQVQKERPIVSVVLRLEPWRVADASAPH